MPDFTTQVLLLHSKQSTLDRFSAWLGDAYSVHLATSGTEALNTLGQTPIHVMISAQNLPGMSGIEALREARKRSPDTLGILVAPDEVSAPELEALVGRNEIFQVIRGIGSPQEMRRLLDEAVHRLKLISLQSSANDRSAGPVRRRSSEASEPMGHAGQTRGNRPLASADAALPGRMSPRVLGPRPQLLVLSKDELFIDTVHQAIAARYAIHVVTNVSAAAKIVEEGQVGVLITDAAVAPREVEAITKRLGKKLPGLVSIVAGRRDDGEELLSLIQSGTIYRFLLKPVSPGRTKLAIDSAMRRFLDGHDSPPGARPVPLPAPAGGKAATRGPVVGGRPNALQERGRPPTATPAPARASAVTRKRPPAGDSRGPLVIAVSAVAVAALTIGMFLWLDGSSDAVDGVAGAAAPEAKIATESRPPAPRISQSLARARKALKQGRLLEPGRRGALLLFAAAMAEEPGSEEIADEAEAALAEAFSAAMATLEDGDLERATAVRSVIAASFPADPRLRELDSQIDGARRDLLIAEAMALADQGDRETALSLLGSSKDAPLAAHPALVSARESIVAATEARGRTLLLELGNQRLLQGQLVEPEFDNARYYYRAVLAQDGESIAGRQGMAFLRSELITRIRESITAGDRSGAEAWILEARLSGVEDDRLARFEEAASSLPQHFGGTGGGEDGSLSDGGETGPAPMATGPAPD